MGRFVFSGKVMYWLSLLSFDLRLSFKFQRRRFLLTLLFIMTINKSQNQSFSHVGIYLVFSHGQLYVDASSVTSKQGLKIMIANEDGDNG